MRIKAKYKIMMEQIYLPLNSKIRLDKKKFRKKIINFFSRRLIGTSVYVKKTNVINKTIRLNHLSSGCHWVNIIASILWVKKPFIVDPSVTCIDFKTSFLILDDVFPLDLYAWKPAEYNEILQSMPEAEVLRLNTAESYAYNLTLEKCTDRSNKRITFLSDGTGIFIGDHIKLVLFQMYCGIESFNILELNRDFIMTFYPSGGFRLFDYECNVKMKTICASPHFKHMIVTQKIMYDYFLMTKICPKEKMTLIFGGCGFPVYSERKPILSVNNICFLANSYGSDKGWKKGYDIFVSVAKNLIKKNKDLKFHVIGNGLDINTIDISSIKKHFFFHGRINLTDLKLLLEKMDMMICPNRPHYFNDGGLDFDGFPVGCAAYGMMCGCPVFMTDPFDLNNGFYKNGHDFIQINFNPSEITFKIQYYIDRPDELNKIAQSGGNKTRELISFDKQIKPRLNLYRHLLEQCK